MIRVVEVPPGRGWAAAANRAIERRRPGEVVVLVDPRAEPAPGWTDPLVAALESDARIGAVTPKLLDPAGFADVRLRTRPFVPGGADTRSLGVRLSGVRNGDVEPPARPLAGFWDNEPGGPDEPSFRWTQAGARLLVEVADAGDGIALRLAAETSKPVTIECGAKSVDVEVGVGTAWVDVPVAEPLAAVVVSVGGVLRSDGTLGSRGGGEPDDGQWDFESDVFAWRRSAVAFSATYLDDVGTFDEQLSPSAAEADLVWRGRERGWRHVAVPSSVVRLAPDHLDEAVPDDERAALVLAHGPLKEAIAEARRTRHPAAIARGLRARRAAGARRRLSAAELSWWVDRP